MAPKQPMRIEWKDGHKLVHHPRKKTEKSGGADHLSGGVDRLGYGTSRACTVYSKLLDSVGQSDFFDVGQGGELSASAQ